MVHYILHCVHDFGYSGLVVGAEKGGAVGGDDGFADMAQDFREFGGLEAHSGHSPERDVGAVVVFDYLGPDVVAGGVGRGVDMGDEAYGRDLGVGVGGYGGHHVAPLVKLGADSHSAEFVAEHFEKYEFLLCRRLAVAGFVGLGVHGDIA